MGRGRSSHMDEAERILVAGFLAEGGGIRPIARILGREHKVIIEWAQKFGEGALRLHNHRVGNLRCDRIMIDEMWSFVWCKQKTVIANLMAAGMEEEEAKELLRTEEIGIGSQWLYVVIDADTKLIIAWHLASQGKEVAAEFLAQLKLRLHDDCVPKLVSDGTYIYKDAIKELWGSKAVYAQYVKDKIPKSKKVPDGDFNLIRKHVFGRMAEHLIHTNYVEAANRGVRAHLRRFGRESIGHSKTWKAHNLSVALYVSYYNFVLAKTYGRGFLSIRTSPAHRAKLATDQWSLPYWQREIYTYQDCEWSDLEFDPALVLTRAVD